MNRSGFRLLLFLLLSAVAGLSGCTLLHPRRITNPNLPPGYKEQQRAAQKAQKNSAKAAANEAKARRKKAQDPDAEATSTAAGAAPTEAATGTGEASRALPDQPTVKYDKNGLMKKPKLKRRHYYRTPTKPFGPWQKIRDLFRKKPQRYHGKSHSEPKPAPAEPTPAPTPAPAKTGLTP